MNKLKIAAIVGIALAFVLSCSDDNNNNTGDEQPAFSVSGKFDKGSGEVVKFQLETAAAAAAKSARASIGALAKAAADNSMTGVLEDGDMIFRLSGTYNPATGTYSASAASSLIRYSISGEFNSSGETVGKINATLSVKDAATGGWKVLTFEVTKADDVAISGTPTESIAGGFPAFAQGAWTVTKSADDDEEGTVVLINQWDLVFPSEDGSIPIISITGSGSTYDMVIFTISSSEVSCEVPPGGNDGVERPEITSCVEEPPEIRTAFMKIRLAFSDNNTKMEWTFYVNGEGNPDFETEDEAEKASTTHTISLIKFTR